MTGNQFKTARKSRLKYSQAELAIAMQTPKRTIQDIEAMGDSEIRGVYAVCIELLCEKDRWVMGEIKRDNQDWLDKTYPNGIKG